MNLESDKGSSSSSSASSSSSVGTETADQSCAFRLENRTLKMIHPDRFRQRTEHFEDAAPVSATQYVRRNNWQQESIFFFCHLV